MSAIQIPRAASYEAMEPGQYFPVRSYGGGSVVGAWLYCPECKHKQLLTAHSISADGTVHPSILCAMAPCTWHVWAVLVDWDEGAVNADA